MNDVDGVRALLEETGDAWVADPESDVVWAGEHEGRRGLRMRQTVRDFTTVWFDVGERTVGIEAYVLPVPPHAAAEIHRQALVRSHRTRRIHFAVDTHGDLVLVGRIPLDEVSPGELELALGEVYALVELSFRPMVAAMRREKSP